ncbi:hypothetical protein Micbo1qcDRAFT_200454 [Microdochium bolleyi]|uniref:Amine oxidase domain-containing protein n=1 Tax=Microdochium bolleyi TaxID=196109 RepID=A0A136JCX0_9PEZI|nr:hypothetical protein Micbo1qcDRAFT_200454 [Microdochium bolleyi]
MALRGAYAQSLVTQHLVEKLRVDKGDPELTSLPPLHGDVIKPLAGNSLAGYNREKKEKICIIGAGAAGLATAMSLHESKFYHIEILEASSEPGGRLFTYDFPQDDGSQNSFCDIGAMRIPDIDRMQATLELLKDLNVKLEPYYYNLKDQDPESKNYPLPNMWWFQDTTPKSKAFAATMNALLLEYGFLLNDTTAGKFDVAYEKFIAEDLDRLSTRAYLLTKGYSYADTLEAELSATGRNGSFDQALLETVCDYLDFQEAKAGKWYRVDGGMKNLVKAMVDKVIDPDIPDTNILYNKSVIALKNDVGKEKIIITVEGEDKPRVYDAVFNTTTLPCLQRMDISELGLPDKVLTGIRSLHYDNSAKVAIKFNSPWYKPWLRTPGGVSTSDLPISNIVYPSFDTEDGKPAVLLASYSWSQDAIRMASIFENSHRGEQLDKKHPEGNKPDVDAPVVKLVLKNIAELWSKSGMKSPPTYECLRKAYVDHFAWSWDHDKYTGGAFALFGPGQFQDFYADFQDPHCQGKFLICGEAISVEHAWISGALNSAYTATMKWIRQRDIALKLHGQGQAQLKNSLLGGGKNVHLPEFSEELLFWTVELKDVVLPHVIKPAAIAA